MAALGGVLGLGVFGSDWLEARRAESLRSERKRLRQAGQASARAADGGRTRTNMTLGEFEPRLETSDEVNFQVKNGGFSQRRGEREYSQMLAAVRSGMVVDGVCRPCESPRAAEFMQLKQTVGVLHLCEQPADFARNSMIWTWTARDTCRRVRYDASGTIAAVVEMLEEVELIIADDAAYYESLGPDSPF